MNATSFSGDGVGPRVPVDSESRHSVGLPGARRNGGDGGLL